MDKFVACLYIQDYRETIAAEADEVQRQKLLPCLPKKKPSWQRSRRAKRKSGASRKELSTPANMSVSRQSACLVSASIHPLRIRRHGKARACGCRGLIGPAPVTSNRCGRYWLLIQRGTWTHCTGWGVLI